METARSSAVFGRRRIPHTVIIAQGDSIRHFTVQPWLVALAGSVLAAFAVGYLLATTYLVLRDDLIGASIARQARLQQAYEDRISSLRAQVDRITSRQLLDQQLMESKVSELLDRQAQLSERSVRMDPLIGRAGAASDRLPVEAPIPLDRPDLRAQSAFPEKPALAATGLRLAEPAAPQGALAFAMSAADKADQIFVAINRSLRRIESEQIERLRSLTEDAYETAETISDALREAGLPVDDAHGETGIGGPLMAPQAPAAFDDEVNELDDALRMLDKVKSAAKSMPIANPVPGAGVSSGFGTRRDPLLGRPAHHSGIDFRAASGHPVRAAGAGVVVRAGWSGGYGRMVEIDHGNGLSTRYAHLSKVAVSKGMAVGAGTIVGRVGSSGRSTGPHLHYEVRREAGAVNPLPFLKAGKRVLPFLES